MLNNLCECEINDNQLTELINKNWKQLKEFSLRKYLFNLVGNKIT